MPFERALALADLPEGGHSKVFVGGQPILVSRLDGQVFAIHDTCLHRGGSLASGPLEGGVVTCPLHFWGFDARTGVCVQVPSLALKAFPTKVDDGEVYIEV
jgi:nitrite reductase/ring-hydroxylating ferredoxin subunit